MKVFILAGGFGTRLSHIVKDAPKPMAPIQGRPFLKYLIDYLGKQGFNDIILLTGYKGDIIENYFLDGRSFGVQIKYSRETDPLGTGGAVKKAAERFCPNEDFIVINGDTYFDAGIKYLMDYHHLSNSLISMALKYKSDVKRYGSVKLSGNRVIEFVEKRSDLDDGFINGGIYVLSHRAISYFNKQGILSLENEVLPGIMKNSEEIISGIPFGGRFIDIGVPEDYYRADKVLESWINEDKIKAAFLDRDGTITEDTGYTYRPEELNFIPGAITFLKELQKMNYRLIIVTNQAGIGKGRFTEKEFINFQEEMQKKLLDYDIGILDSFYCPYHKEAVIEKFKKESLLRKPGPGMILEAADKHNIDLYRSLMIGDKESDNIESLPYLKCFIIAGKYPINDNLKTYDGFNTIIQEIKQRSEYEYQAKN